MKNEVPIAEEILNRDYTSTKENAIKAMIEFAKLHVTAALQSAGTWQDYADYEMLKGAYPLENIK